MRPAHPSADGPAAGPESPHADRDFAAVLELLPLALVDANLDLDAHLQTLAEAIRTRLGADAVLIRLVDPEHRFLTLRACALSEASRTLGVGIVPRTWPLGPGLTGSVMRSSQSQLVGNIEVEQGSPPRAPGLSGTVITAPLTVRGEAIGVLRVSALGENRFGPTDQRFVESLALAAGIAVENARLAYETQSHIAELETRQRELETLAEIGTLVLESHDSGSFGAVILDRAIAVGGFDMGMFHLLRPEIVEPIATRGLLDSTHAQSYPRGSAGRRALFQAIETRVPVVVEDVSAFDGLRVLKSEGVRSAILVPVHTGADVLGTLMIGSRAPRRFAASTVQLLAALGSQCGVAFQKAQLYTEIEDALADAQRSARERATSLSLLEGTLEATTDGIAVIDGSGTILHFNQHLLDMWRVPLALIEQGDRACVAYVRDQLVDPEAFEAWFRDILANPWRDSFDVLELKDGRVFECTSRAKQIVDQRPVRVWSFHDITERRRAEQQLLRAQRLETAGRIAGQVAHDFNNLLSPLLGFPELLRAELPAGHRGLAYCDLMIQAVEQMAHINEDLLALGRRGHFEQAPIDLNALVRRTIGQLAPPEPTLTTAFELAPDLLPMSGNAAQVARLIMNLVTNAREAMREIGTLTIRTRNIYVDMPTGELTQVPIGEYVQLQVSDSGPGIPPEIRHQIFDAFFTTKPTATRRGAGLGLSVVQAVVDDHDGFLDLHSELGVETTFSVYFRVAREAERRAAAGVVVTGGAESILIVDDDPFQRAVARELLASLGYRVRAVASGEEALRAMREQPADLLVLDMVMPPGIDGAETFRRARERFPRQRAILLSGFAETDRVSLAQQLGAGRLLRKPSSRDALAVAVRSELDRPA